MTNLDITVNDGLRLSELYGQLGDLNYKMENLGLYIHDEKLKATILIIVLGIIIGFTLCAGLHLLFYDSYNREASLKVIVSCMVLYVVALVVIWFLWMGHIDTYAVYNLECDISRVQGEIDGILARYGGASP